jgi:hypothetical protein
MLGRVAGVASGATGRLGSSCWSRRALPLAQLGGWGQAVGDAGVASCAAGRLLPAPTHSSPGDVGLWSAMTCSTYPVQMIFHTFRKSLCDSYFLISIFLEILSVIILDYQSLRFYILANLIY